VSIGLTTTADRPRPTSEASLGYLFLLIGLIMTLATPALSRRVGEALVRDAGLAEEPAPASPAA